MLRILWPLILLLSYVNGQDLLTLLGQQPSLSQFSGYISQFPDLVRQLDGGNFTVLAPSNAAFTNYFNQAQTTTIANDTLRALLEYHCTKNIFASATLSTGPFFPATLLTNKTYTNVTGGQVVELTTTSAGKPVVLSAIKAPSTIIQPDIFYIGGLIQIVDSVLTIPISFPATITQARLSDLVALLNKGGWLSPTSSAFGIVDGLSDLTIFAPDSPQYGASFTGWNGLSTADLDTIFEYSIVQGSVVYSTGLTNQSHFKTLEGSSVTITVLNNQSYVDQALVTTQNYLTANGVLQLLDQPLNPNNTGQTPAYTPKATPKSSGSQGLSSVAGAGIGIAVAAIVIAGVIVGLLVWRRKRRTSTRFELHPRIPAPGQKLEEGVELDGKTISGQTTVYEVGPPRTPPEIDGRERSRISITLSGPPPKHVGFQAKY